MLNSIIASAVLLASATVVDALGHAVVVNQCSDTVQVDNVPAVGNAITDSLTEGQTYSQQWTSLPTGGWSIKLYRGSSGEPLQYEYTLQDDGTLWFDLSAVNADPFNGDWYISGGTGCQTKQTAYQYPTDDANGMQDSCSSSSTVTLFLCGSGGGGSSAPSSGGAPAPSSAGQPDPSANSSPQESAPAPSSADQPAISAPTPSLAAVSVPAVSGAADKVADFNKLQATTLNTQIKPAAATVTNVHTQVVTQFVTVSPMPVKRAEHIHRHADHHNNF